jgi:hypothetical protein
LSVKVVGLRGGVRVCHAPKIGQSPLN